MEIINNNLIENFSTEHIKEIASCFSSLTKQAREQYVPLVYNIIDNNLKDDNEIQRILDGVLDFCYDEKMLLLYRRLCKYYYDINPIVTIDYIGFYREMYDEEDQINSKMVGFTHPTDKLCIN
jgi:hypothetical protein